MKLIEKVEVTGFRSIQNQTLDALAPFTVLVGKNSSGRSNILRALNLFFNDEVSPGHGVSFARDHYEQEPRLRKKKKIEVTVHFRLPGSFNYRKSLEHLQTLGECFAITRA